MTVRYAFPSEHPFQRESGKTIKGRTLRTYTQVSILVAQQHIGFQQIYDAGMANGNGTDEERAIVSNMLATWKETHERLQDELKALSGRTRLRSVDCQHDIHVLDPEAVVEDVVWILSLMNR